MFIIYMQQTSVEKEHNTHLHYDSHHSDKLRNLQGKNKNRENKGIVV